MVGRPVLDTAVSNDSGHAGREAGSHYVNRRRQAIDADTLRRVRWATRGLTPDQLFSYWSDSGIDGTLLTADNPVPIDTGDVETNLSDQYVLMAAESRPDGFPPGQTGGGHMWIVVGYSDYGPMSVTWGQEVQICWAEFDSWTTGIWGIGVSS